MNNVAAFNNDIKTTLLPYKYIIRILNEFLNKI